MMEGKPGASRVLVMSVLAALMSERPILITSTNKHHGGTFVTYVSNAIEQVFGIRDPPTVICRESSTSEDLASAIPSNPGRVLCFANIDKLPTVLQLQLVDIFTRRRASSPLRTVSLQSTSIICTRGSGKLTTLLRDVIMTETLFDPAGEIHAIDRIPNSPSVLENAVDYKKRLASVTITAEVYQYMQDVVLFLRNHRFVRGGVSPRAVRDVEVMVRLICTAEHRTFASPGVVAIACRHVLPLKIRLCNPVDEPSLQYGSDIEIEARWLAQHDEAGLVDSVLDQVPPPV